MDGQYNPGDIVLGNWTLTRLIGEGSFGRVFEAERVDFGHTYKSAIKIITIPQSKSEIRSVIADGMDPESARAYFRGMVEELVAEFTLMSGLKGNSNIASYEDHTVVQHSGALSGASSDTACIGWDIIIRMELLTPLLDYVQSRELTQSDIMRLGIDMCKALELCQRQNIIHRDVKPENIFVSKMGDFKLGDFGIARTVEKTTSGLSKKGTYSYMAPEVYKGEAYGSSVDMYSLGIVLYRLLNNNRTPFMPEYPTPITHNDRDASLVRRMNGEKLPIPKNTDARIADFVLKACAYDPKDRYASPMQMREVLEAALLSSADSEEKHRQSYALPTKQIVKESTSASITSIDSRIEAVIKTPRVPRVDKPRKAYPVYNKSKNTMAIVACVVCLLVAGGVFFYIIRSNNGNDSSQTMRDSNSYESTDITDVSPNDASTATTSTPSTHAANSVTATPRDNGTPTLSTNPVTQEIDEPTLEPPLAETISPSPSAQPEEPEPIPEEPSRTPEPRNAAAYRAYHEILTSAIEEYGLYGVDQSWGTGIVAAAWLIDFDNDGLSELVYTLEYAMGVALFVYGYSNNPVLLFEGFMGGGDANVIRILGGRNGQVYLLYDRIESVDWESDTVIISEIYYTVNNSRWVISLDNAYTADGDPWNSLPIAWTVNGSSVSEEEYNAAPSSVLGVTGDLISLDSYNPNPSRVYALLDELLM